MNYLFRMSGTRLSSQLSVAIMIVIKTAIKGAIQMFVYDPVERIASSFRPAGFPLRHDEICTDFNFLLYHRLLLHRVRNKAPV